MDKNIALLLYTSGLDYDDRIRKEILTIKKLFPGVNFKIFAVEHKNREESGTTSYGVPYRIHFLKSREKYASGTHTLAKAWDFYKSVREELKEFDAIWCADIETFLFVFLAHGKPVLWDLHELPARFMHNPIMKLLFRHLERKCRVMMHANEARLNLLDSMGLVSNRKKHFVLRNYPQFNEIDTEYDDKYRQFDLWLGNSKCVYLQGVNDANRAAFESIDAVMSFPEIKAVVVGNFEQKILARLKEKYGDDLSHRIFFTGMVKQLKTPQYIRRCFMSLVFYKNTSPNNFYCEANRFYQNIINGNPVVVGNNPPMRELIERYGFGVSIDDDGSDVEAIIAGIKQLMSQYDDYKANIDKNKQHLLWDSQVDTHKSIIKKIFD